MNEPRRSMDQNALMWALLTDISKQVIWPVDGEMVKLDKEDWKAVISAGLKRTQRIAKGIEGGFVMLGASTSKMSKAEMADLITLIEAFGSQQGVRFSAPERMCA